MKNKNVIRLRKFEPKLCPSGAWDNGLYKLTDHYVDIPKSLFEQAIIEDYEIDTPYAQPQNKRVTAKRITIEGSRWIVQNDPDIFE